VRGKFFIAEFAQARGKHAGRSAAGPVTVSRAAAAVRGSGALVAVLGLLAAACQGQAARPGAAAPVPPARITITTGNLTFSSPAGLHRGSVVTRSALRPLVDKRPDLGIEVSVTGGRLVRVSAVNGLGRAVPGELAGGAADWRANWALSPDQAYHVSATAVNPHGRATTIVSSFRTLTPRHTFSAMTSLGTGQEFGVGMPIMVTFSHPITRRAEVERSLEIWSSKPVTGAWYWMSSTQVWFRPRAYWPAHTRLRFEAHLKGVQGARGSYGDANLTQRFRIGNALVAVASAANHHMKVWWNGHLKGDWPISTGQPGDDTPDGHYLSFSMGNPVRMDSASYGVMPGQPGYYNVLVYDSVKFTNSGDYVHSAPWSVAEQGFSNVSHGCVNVAPGNAAWYYGHSLIGDPISVVGSPLRGTWGDGWTIWFLSWRKLVAGSATHKMVVAGPGGSQLVPAQVSLPSSMRLHASSGGSGWRQLPPGGP
jgi:lipoprotein-anchoring transpeptidase ErfK/SrfK